MSWLQRFSNKAVTALKQAPAYVPELNSMLSFQRGIVNGARASSRPQVKMAAGVGIRIANYDPNQMQSRVVLRGQIAAPLQHFADSSDGTPFSLTTLKVQYMKGQASVEDMYALEIFGSNSVEFRDKLQPGQYVAVEGFLRLDKTKPDPVIVDVDTIFHCPDYVPSAAPPRPAYSASQASGTQPQQPMGYRPPQPAYPAAQAPPAQPAYGAPMVGTPRPVMGMQQQQQAVPPQQQYSQPPGAGQQGDVSWLASASIEDKWAFLRDNPSAFFDNRTTKTNPKAPDFKLKKKDQADVALWVDSKNTPQWAREMFTVQPQY